MRSAVLLGGMVVWVGAAFAQPASHAPDELLDLRLHYGVALHTGLEQGAGPGLSYGGLTPNDAAFTGWVWPALDGRLGFTAHIEREAFGLYDGPVQVTHLGLIRTHGAVAGRFRFGPVRLEPALGYAFDQLPAYTAALAGHPQARHSALLALRGAVDVGRVAVEARLDVPMQLPVGGLAFAVGPDAFSAAVGVRVELVRSGKLVFGGAAEAAWVADRYTLGTVTSSQTVFRAGLALDVQWKDEPPPVVVPPTVGVLRIAVISADDAGPLPKASLTVQSAGGPLTIALGPDGTGRAADVVPGALVASASLDGYVPAEERGQLAAGAETALVLRLRKEAPKVGALAFTITDKASSEAVGGATITVAGKSATTGDSGQAVIEALAPGPASVDVTAEGYQPGQETASVVAGVSSKVSVQLLSAKKRTQATITGIVRSARGGAPVAANLAIPEAKIKTRAGRDGQFSFHLVGGTYTVNISAKGFLSQTKSVTVQDGDEAIFNVDLSPR